MLFEIAADVSKAGQHWLKVRILLNLRSLDVLRSQVICFFFWGTLKEEQTGFPWKRFFNTHSGILVARLYIFFGHGWGFTKSRSVPPGLRWIGWSTSCSGHPQTEHWTARCCHQIQEISHRWARDLPHIHCVRSFQNGPCTANSLGISPILHTSTSPKNQSSMGKGRTPSKPLALIAALVEHDFREACWQKAHWRCQTWPRMVSFPTWVGKDFKTNDNRSVVPNFHPRYHDKGLLPLFRTKLRPEPPAHVVISADLVKNRKINCYSDRFIVLWCNGAGFVKITKCTLCIRLHE